MNRNHAFQVGYFSLHSLSRGQCGYSFPASLGCWTFRVGIGWGCGAAICAAGAAVYMGGADAVYPCWIMGTVMTLKREGRKIGWSIICWRGILLKTVRKFSMVAHVWHLAKGYVEYVTVYFNLDSIFKISCSLCNRLIYCMEPKIECTVINSTGKVVNYEPTWLSCCRICRNKQLLSMLIYAHVLNLLWEK